MGNVVIDRSTKFNEQLNRLRTFGGVAAEAARGVAQIVGNITTAVEHKPDKYGRLTKHGESRIKNCYKYDLAGFYRLVTIQVRDTVFLLFVGTHDEADRYLNAHRGMEPVINRDGKITIVDSKDHSRQSPLPQIIDIVLPEKKLFSYLTQSELSFLSPPIIGLELNHFSSDEDILRVIDTVDPSKSELLLDVLIHLRDCKPESAKARIELEMGLASTLKDFPGDIGEVLKKDVNKENLVNLRDLSSQEYEHMLKGTLADWMLFLHPDQRVVAYGDYPGVVRLQGVAGSGKTSVLLHRAKHLAEKYPTEKIGVFTLNPSLAALLRDLLSDMTPPETLSRILVLDVESFARNVVSSFKPQQLLQILDEKSNETLEDCFWDSYEKPEQKETLKTLSEYLSNREVEATRYIRDEFTWVRSAFQAENRKSKSSVIPLRSTYLDASLAPREGRSIPFSTEYRKSILTALEYFEDHLESGGFSDQAATMLVAHSCLDLVKTSKSPFKFRSILVDEVQDLSTIELELLSATVDTQENNIFLTGDPEQQVYPKEHNLKKSGIEVSSRRFFKRNYRNPRQILEAGLELLKRYGNQGIDPDDDKNLLSPQYAARNSAKPLLVRCQNIDDELNYISKVVRRRQNETFLPICIILADAREDDESRISDVEAKLSQSGLTVVPLRGAKKLEPGTVYLSGLETVKGFEFSRVIIAGVGANFPAPYLPADEAWRDVRRLYVALTRARDEAILTFVENKSKCFDGIEEFFSETLASDQLFEVEEVLNEERRVTTNSAPDVEHLDSNTSEAAVPSNLPVTTSAATLPQILIMMGLEVIDKRDRGGCLWVVGGEELNNLMSLLGGKGYYFSLTMNGSKTTRRRPGWYLK